MILNIAKANEINPAKPRYSFRPHSLSNVSPSFTAPTGPVSLLNAPLIFVPLKESRFHHKLHNALIVSFVSAPISCNHASIALPRGNLIGFILKLSDIEKRSPRRQSSSQHVQLPINMFLPLW